jgi:hypothetical protein
VVMGFTKRQKGFGLTEGLIGLAVLSTGLLAIYGVHTSYIKSFSDERQKSEMMSKLSSEMTKAKSFSSCESLSNYAATLTDISMSVSEHNEDETVCDIAVSGTWSSPISSGTVAVSGIVFLRNFSLSSSDSFGESDGGVGSSKISPPTGDAVYGDGTNKQITESNLVQRDDLFGTAVIEDGGVYYLLDSATDDNGANVLESSNPFYRIKGTIYASEDGVKNFTLKEANIYAGAPDISICKTAHAYKSHVDSGSYPVAIPYQCYVGSRWYGSIGVVENNDSDTLLDKDSCVGSPSHLDDGTDYSRHAQGSLSRRYTKYLEVSADTVPLDDLLVREYIEIGTPECGSTLDYQEGRCTLSNHDFMVVKGPNKASPTEAENAANCVTNMTAISGASFSLATNFESAVSAGEYSFYPISGSSVSDISNNPGSYYCLGGENGSSMSGGEVVCPEFTDAPYVATNTTFDVFVWAKNASGNSYEQIATSNLSVSAKGALESAYIPCMPDPSNKLFKCGSVSGALSSAVTLSNGVYKPYWYGSVKAEVSSANCVGLVDGDDNQAGDGESVVSGSYSISAQGEDERLNLQNNVAGACTVN